MIALAYLLFFGVYFWLMVIVVSWAWRKGLAKGSRPKALLYAVTVSRDTDFTASDLYRSKITFSMGECFRQRFASQCGGL